MRRNDYLRTASPISRHCAPTYLTTRHPRYLGPGVAITASQHRSDYQPRLQP